jgi:hypothetical protein
MNDTPAPHKALQARRKDERAQRRKAELKANMARRKAQIRARGGQGDDQDNSQDIGAQDNTPNDAR